MVVPRRPVSSYKHKDKPARPSAHARDADLAPAGRLESSLQKTLLPETSNALMSFQSLYHQNPGSWGLWTRDPCARRPIRHSRANAGALLDRHPGTDVLGRIARKVSG